MVVARRIADQFDEDRRVRVLPAFQNQLFGGGGLQAVPGDEGPEGFEGGWGGLVRGGREYGCGGQK